MTKQRIVGFLFLCFFGLYSWSTGNIYLDFFSEGEAFNARSFPYLIGAGGIIISCLLIVVPDRHELDTLSMLAPHLNWQPVLLLLLTMVIYGFSFEFLGFFIATNLLLISGFLILEERRIKVILGASSPLTTGFWLLMDFMGIYLEPGTVLRTLGFAS